MTNATAKQVTAPHESTVLSAQEQAIVTGKKVLHGTVTERILRMFEAIRSSGPPRVALERAIYFTESFKTTEGQPLVLRWAKALKHIAENISVAIFDDELIVGRPNTYGVCPQASQTAWPERQHAHHSDHRP